MSRGLAIFALLFLDGLTLRFRAGRWVFRIRRQPVLRSLCSRRFSSPRDDSTRVLSAAGTGLA
jgi:hypothetical protein